MHAGELDSRITFLRSETVTDKFGGKSAVWIDLCEVWCKHTPVRDAERVQADQVGSSRTDRFQIRYSSMVSDLDPRDQAEFEGRRYAIVAVKPIGRREALEITANALAEDLRR